MSGAPCTIQLFNDGHRLFAVAQVDLVSDDADRKIKKRAVLRLGSRDFVVSSAHNFDPVNNTVKVVARERPAGQPQTDKAILLVATKFKIK